MEALVHHLVLHLDKHCYCSLIHLLIAYIEDSTVIEMFLHAFVSALRHRSLR